MPPIARFRCDYQESEHSPHYFTSSPKLNLRHPFLSAHVYGASVGPSQTALSVASVGTGSQSRESSSALVPSSVLPGPVNTEPVSKKANIVLAMVQREKRMY